MSGVSLDGFVLLLLENAAPSRRMAGGATTACRWITVDRANTGAQFRRRILAEIDIAFL
jgi:hypothetical protein